MGSRFESSKVSNPRIRPLDFPDFPDGGGCGFFQQIPASLWINLLEGEKEVQNPERRDVPMNSYFIRSQFRSRCASCGGVVKKGQPVFFIRTPAGIGHVVHPTCAAPDFDEQVFIRLRGRPYQIRGRCPRCSSEVYAGSWVLITPPLVYHLICALSPHDHGRLNCPRTSGVILPAA